VTSDELREQADKLDAEASGYDWTAEQIIQYAERTRSRAREYRRQAAAEWFAEQDRLRDQETFPLRPPMWI